MEDVAEVKIRNVALPELLVAILAVFAIVGPTHSQEIRQAKDQPEVQQKIARALSAGPDSITKNGTVAEPDGHGGPKILRPGTNDFTCMPGEHTPPLPSLQRWARSAPSC